MAGYGSAYAPPTGPFTPRPRPGRRIFFVVLLSGFAVAVFMAGWAVADHRRESSKPVASSPALASAEPGEVQPAPGFPRTPTGAGDAWTYFLRRAMTNDITAQAKEDLFTSMVVPAVIPDVKAELLGRDQPWVSPDQETGFGALRVSTVEEGDAVRVTAWGVTVWGQLPPSSRKVSFAPTATWMRLSTRMVWDGGWKITGVHFEEGPMPAAPQVPASAEEIGEQLFGPDSRPAF